MVKLTSKYTISEKTHEVYSKKSNISESLFSGTFEECCDYVSNLDESIANTSYIRKISSLNIITEDWSRGLLIKIDATPESVQSACEAGKLNIPAVNSEGFENCIGQHSLIVRFPNGNNIFDFLNIYDEVCEFHYTLYDNDVRHEVDGGISAINRMVKTQQITDSVRHIIDSCANALRNAGIEIMNINVRVVGGKGKLEFNESLKENYNTTDDNLLKVISISRNDYLNGKSRREARETIYKALDEAPNGATLVLCNKNSYDSLSRSRCYQESTTELHKDKDEWTATTYRRYIDSNGVKQDITVTSPSIISERRIVDLITIQQAIPVERNKFNENIQDIKSITDDKSYNNYDMLQCTLDTLDNIGGHDLKVYVNIMINNASKSELFELMNILGHSDPDNLNDLQQSFRTTVDNMDDHSIRELGQRLAQLFSHNILVKIAKESGYLTSEEDLSSYIIEDVNTTDEDEISEIEQEFTSQNTSINSTKLPAIFKLVKFEPNTINLDYGGGKFDNAAEYLKEFDVTNLVYDPYNRTGAHNSEVIKTIKQNGGADSATCSNVLNVVKEENVRINILNNIKKLVKPNGKVYITVYEGSGSGDGTPTKAGYQMNRKTDDYLEEIKSVFPDAVRRGKLITATNSNSSKSANESVDTNSQNSGKYSFKIGDKFNYSSLFGGIIDVVVKDIKDNKLYADISWTAEDTGKLCHDSAEYELTTDNAGDECIVIWEYKGEKGYVYPPESYNYDVKESISGSELHKAPLGTKIIDANGRIYVKGQHYETPWKSGDDRYSSLYLANSSKLNVRYLDSDDNITFNEAFDTSLDFPFYFFYNCNNPSFGYDFQTYARSLGARKVYGKHKETGRANYFYLVPSEDVYNKLKSVAKDKYTIDMQRLLPYNSEDYSSVQYIKEDIEHNNKLVIEVKSGISADGFNCTVYDSTDKVVYRREYSYGYNASYSRDWADTDAPYVTDIINDLCAKYSINKNDIKIVAGKNTFKGTGVSTDDVEEFKQKYLNESKSINEGNDFKYFKVRGRLDVNDTTTKVEDVIVRATSEDDIGKHMKALGYSGYSDVEELTDEYTTLGPIKEELDYVDNYNDCTIYNNNGKFISNYMSKSLSSDSLDGIKSEIDKAKQLYKDKLHNLAEDSDQLDTKFVDGGYEKYIKLDLMEPDDNYSYTIGGKEVPYKSHDEAKKHLKDFKFSDYEKELYEFLKSKDMYNEMYVEPDNTLCIRVENGDWKHEHLYLDNLIHKFFFDKGLIIDSQKEVTSSDGSDCFSANHYYRIVDVIFSMSLKPVNEDINDADEILNFKRDVKSADNADDIQDLIYSLSDGVAEDNCQTAFYENEDKDLQTLKDAVISALDIYLEDNEWLGESLLQDIHKDFANIEKRYGKAVYNALNDYIKLGHDLGDILYKKSEWDKFENWCNENDIFITKYETFTEDLENPLEDKLEDINFVMSNYVSRIFDKVEGKDTDWTISYNNETVDLKFDPSYGEYVYTLDGEGPFSHSSYEFISRDIMDYIDTHKIKSEDTQVKENTNQQLNNIKDSYLRDAWTFEPYVGSDKDNTFKTKVHRRGLGEFSVYVKGFNYNNLEELQELSEVKIQVTTIKPYDDAEYHWAKYENSVTKIIKNGKVVKKIPTDLSSMNPDSQKDAIDFVICDICNTLADLNVDIEPKMVHN